MNVFVIDKMKPEVKNKIVKFLLNSVDNIQKHLGKVDKYFRIHIDNVDAWIKKLNKRITKVEGLDGVVNENIGNIQHNYELIYELQDELEEQKQEIYALKLIQIITLKKGRDTIIKERDLVRKRKEGQEKENERVNFKGT